MFRHAVMASALLLVSGLAADQGPQRPKIYGVAFVRLKSFDFSKASETYSKILGLGTGTSKGTNGCTNVKNPCFVVNEHQHVELLPAHAGDPGSRKSLFDQQCQRHARLPPLPRRQRLRYQERP